MDSSIILQHLATYLSSIGLDISTELRHSEIKQKFLDTEVRHFTIKDRAFVVGVKMAPEVSIELTCDSLILGKVRSRDYCTLEELFAAAFARYDVLTCNLHYIVDSEPALKSLAESLLPYFKKAVLLVTRNIIVFQVWNASTQLSIEDDMVKIVNHASKTEHLLCLGDPQSSVSKIASTVQDCLMNI